MKSEARLSFQQMGRVSTVLLEISLTSCCKMTFTWSKSGKFLDFYCQDSSRSPASYLCGLRIPQEDSRKFPVGLKFKKNVYWLLIPISKEKQINSKQLFKWIGMIFPYCDRHGSKTGALLIA